MSEQFLRKCSLVVGNPATNAALDLSELHIRFQVRRGDIQTPNSADICIYNLSDRTAKQILTGNLGQGNDTPEFTNVVLSAGYQNNIGLIFKGTIMQVRRGRETQADTYVDIRAADGDEAYNFSVMNTSVAAGSVAADHVKLAAQQMNVPIGYMPDLTKNPLPRGKVFYGMSRDYLRRITQSQNANYSIQDGSLQIVSLTNFIPGEVVQINSATGMIGWPEQTANGVHIRTLLNSNIKIGTVVQIDNSSILDYQFGLDPSGQLGKSVVPRVDADGYYQTYIAEYSGDTRGQEWYTDLICLSVDQSAIGLPTNQMQKTSVAPVPDRTPVRRNP